MAPSPRIRRPLLPPPLSSLTLSGSLASRVPATEIEVVHQDDDAASGSSTKGYRMRASLLARHDRACAFLAAVPARWIAVRSAWNAQPEVRARWSDSTLTRCPHRVDTPGVVPPESIPPKPRICAA
jgi:hypothetical protein